MTLSNEYTWIDNPDIVQMDVPRLQFQRVAWRNHEFPLWDPHLWCGQPFLGEIVGAAYPINWLLFLYHPSGNGQLSLSALNWYFVFLHFLGALFAYWLCLDLGLPLLASLLGGFVYSFAGMIGLTLWPEVLGSLLLAPLVLLFVLRAFRGHRPFGSAAMSGMFLGLAWLSGHHEVPIYLTLVVGAICLYRLAADLLASHQLASHQLASHQVDWRRSLGVAGTAVLFTVLVSGLQTVPGYEYSKLAVRWVGLDHPVGWKDAIPYRIDAENSFVPSSLTALIVPWGGHNVEAFVGIVVLCLAVIAIFTRWSDRFVRLFTCLALGGLLLSLGGWNLIHGILYATLPLFGKARIPSRFLSIFDLGIAPLAAAGLDSLGKHGNSPVMRLAYRALIALGAGIAAMGLAAPAFQKPGPSDTLFLAGFIAILFGCLVLARFHAAISGLHVRLAAAALVFIELGNFGAAIYRDRVAYHRETLLPKLTEYRDIADFLRRQPGPVRVNADAMGAFNFGDWEGIDTLSGFGAGVTSNFLALNWPSARTQNLLGVGYTLTTTQAQRADQQAVFRGASGVNVLKNADAFPRTWIVHRIMQASSPEDLRTRLDDPAFDARGTGLLLESGPSVQSCTGDELAQISQRAANSVVLDARLNCQGMLILSDVWYPGWVAQVDGAPAQIYQPYAALRGVVLEQGRHRVEFHYRPMSARFGAGMSILGILGACAVVLWERLRSSRPAVRETYSG
ncbi:MAG TPA: hypothetical protein VNY05_36250 [Candidatus Acidoferrales bacterium]|nr:hypothetical protein [Candidatus Acidoferrales bacterium]